MEANIKPRVGDVLEEGIVARDGSIQAKGAVVISRTRLRRAIRFGWFEVKEDHPLLMLINQNPDLVLVGKF